MATAYEKEFIEANQLYAKSFNIEGVNIVPRKKAIFITCMDCRLNPAAAYGLDYGDAIVLRNAGATHQDAVRSTILSAHLLGVQEIFLVKHTKCGLLGVPVEAVHDVFKKNLGVTESKDVDDFAPLTFMDLEESAREGVRYFREHALWKKDVRISGWIHDTDIGLVKKVVE